MGVLISSLAPLKEEHDSLQGRMYFIESDTYKMTPLWTLSSLKAVEINLLLYINWLKFDQSYVNCVAK